MAVLIACAGKVAEVKSSERYHGATAFEFFEVLFRGIKRSSYPMFIKMLQLMTHTFSLVSILDLDTCFILLCLVKVRNGELLIL